MTPSCPLHCCQQMSAFLEEKKVHISYSQRFRQYGIVLSGGNVIQEIYYCPWCGTKLPGSLKDEYFQTLDRLGAINKTIFSNDIPDDFRSDKWWKSGKYGLFE